jgi:hypothetical protein
MCWKPYSSPKWGWSFWLTINFPKCCPKHWIWGKEWDERGNLGGLTFFLREEQELVITSLLEQNSMVLWNSCKGSHKITLIPSFVHWGNVAIPMDLSSSEEPWFWLLLTLLPNGPHSNEPALAKKSFWLSAELVKLPAECSLPVTVTQGSGMELPETQQRWEWGPMWFGSALINIALPPINLTRYWPRWDKEINRFSVTKTKHYYFHFNFKMLL